MLSIPIKMNHIFSTRMPITWSQIFILCFYVMFRDKSFFMLLFYIVKNCWTKHKTRYIHYLKLNDSYVFYSVNYTVPRFLQIQRRTCNYIVMLSPHLFYSFLDEIEIEWILIHLTTWHNTSHPQSNDNIHSTLYNNAFLGLIVT